MVKKLIIGNWKMNPQSLKEAEILFRDINKIAKDSKGASIVVCPPFPFLSIYNKQKYKKIVLGSQDVSIEEVGSHTGEVSAKMLASSGVSYVIVGHSERRSIGETNNIINKKLTNILKAKMSPILCVGEITRDNNGEYLKFIKDQIQESLVNISKAQLGNIIIAYEPIWAIGANAEREATAEEFIEIKIFIRKVISDIYGAKTAHNTKVLYGGSVNPKNSKEFLHHGGADGLLVGRDSLVVRKLNLIIKSI